MGVQEREREEALYGHRSKFLSQLQDMCHEMPGQGRNSKIIVFLKSRKIKK